MLDQRKATALKGLPLFMREKSGSFLKSCLVSVCFQSISIPEVLTRSCKEKTVLSGVRN